MSGIEVAGLVFGVVPVVVETLKSYSFLKDKLHTCRRYSEEVEEVAARLASSRTNFRNEVQLLRRCSKNNKAAGMRDDDARFALDESYESCLKTIERTKKILDKMDCEMRKFDELLARKSEGHSIRHLRNVIQIAFNETKYDKLLRRLRERNKELQNFRLQIEALKEPRNNGAEGICIQHQPLPAHFYRVQLASRQLHAALHASWNCSNASQRRHHAKLCLDAEVDEEGDNDVRLDLAISCQRLLSGSCPSIPVAKPYIWLYVRSAFVAGPSNDAVRADRSDYNTQMPQATDPNEAPRRARNKRRRASTDLASQAKRVHWKNWPDPDSVPMTTAQISVGTIADLQRTKNMCDFLRQTHQTLLKEGELRCIGYLQSPRQYRHSFYVRNDSIRQESGKNAVSRIISFKDALEQNIYGNIGPMDQLRIAHKLAVAVLQYNETPWLPNHWRLQDLRYLGTSTIIDAGALKTLHVSLELKERANVVELDGLQLTRDAVTNETRRGIMNPTLFCLGVALLEIAHWSSIEGLMTEEDERDPVIAARRLEKDRSISLGLEYLSIARRCLWCDFGFGDQLSEKGLQSAVYTNVVWELEEMIARFRKLGLK